MQPVKLSLTEKPSTITGRNWAILVGPSTTCFRISSRWVSNNSSTLNVNQITHMPEHQVSASIPSTSQGLQYYLGSEGIRNRWANPPELCAVSMARNKCVHTALSVRHKLTFPEHQWRAFVEAGAEPQVEGAGGNAFGVFWYTVSTARRFMSPKH